MFALVLSLCLKRLPNPTAAGLGALADTYADSGRFTEASIVYSKTSYLRSFAEDARKHPLGHPKC